MAGTLTFDPYAPPALPAMTFSRENTPGGGGYCVRPKGAADGTLVTSSDTNAGGHFTDIIGGPFVPMLRVGDNIDYPDDLDFGHGNGGTYDSAIHWNESDYQMTWFGGWLWKTRDRWATVVKVTALGENTDIAPNNGWRYTPGSRMEYDPGDATGNTWAICDGDGVHYTVDDGANFVTVSSSAPSAGYAGSGCYIVFDRSSSVVSNETQTVFIYQQGVGIKQSTTGITGTFTLLNTAGMPTAATDIKVGPTGILFVCGVETPDGGSLKRWTSGGGWVACHDSTGTGGAFTVLPHPSVSTRVFWFNHAGGLFRSNDTGATLHTYNNAATPRTATDYEWLDLTYEDYMSQGGAIFDALDDTRIIIAMGIGVWETFNPLSSAGVDNTTVWNSITEGIYNLVTMEPVITTEDWLLSAHQDRPVFSTNLNTPASQPVEGLIGSGVLGSIHHGGGVDYAGDNPAVGYCTSNFSGRKLHKTTDRGVTPWTDTAQPTAVASMFGGGCVSVSTANNFVWIPSGGWNRFFYSLDGGATLVEVTSLGGTALGAGDDVNATWWHNFYPYQRQIAWADKDNPLHHYIYCYGFRETTSGGANPDYGNATDLALRGIWKTEDGGVNWVRIYAGYVLTSGLDFYNAKLRGVSRGLGNAPWLFFMAGDVSGAGDDTIASPACKFSKDGGDNWVNFTALAEPHDIKPGLNYDIRDWPALYARGWKVGAGTAGLYRCVDFNPDDPNDGDVWELLDHAPGGVADTGWTLGASMTSNTIALGYGGSGLVIGRA